MSKLASAVVSFGLIQGSFAGECPSPETLTELLNKRETTCVSAFSEHIQIPDHGQWLVIQAPRDHKTFSKLTHIKRNLDERGRPLAKSKETRLVHSSNEEPYKVFYEEGYNKICDYYVDGDGSVILTIAQRDCNKGRSGTSEPAAKTSGGQGPDTMKGGDEIKSTHSSKSIEKGKKYLEADLKKLGLKFIKNEYRAVGRDKKWTARWEGGSSSINWFTMSNNNYELWDQEDKGSANKSKDNKAPLSTAARPTLVGPEK